MDRRKWFLCRHCLPASVQDDTGFASSGIYTILQNVHFEKRVMTTENMFLAKFHHFTTIFKVEFLLIIIPVLCLAAMMPTLLPFFNIVVEIRVGRV
jgi:uncharacterized membrane protein YesL